MRFIIILIMMTILGTPTVFSAQLSNPTTTPTFTLTYNQSYNNGFLKVANDKQSFRRPDKGMSKGKVKRLFGDPIRKMPATGKPPIERWVYEKFTVYFEGKYVIHAVKNRQFSPPKAQ